MSGDPRLSHTAAIILQAVSTGYVYGLSIMDVTGLPSGTVYPALRRLERDDLIQSRWERQSLADAEKRPARKYYEVTRKGQEKLATVLKRYPLLSKIEQRTVEPA